MLSKEQLEKIANPGAADIGGTQNQIVTEMATELLSLREQLAELKALLPVAWRWRFCAQNVVTLDKDRAMKSNEMGVDDFTELFTAAKPLNGIAIEDSLVEQVGLMCDEAININEKNAYGHAYCILKYGILPYLRNQGQ